MGPPIRDRGGSGTQWGFDCGQQPKPVNALRSYGPLGGLDAIAVGDAPEVLASLPGVALIAPSLLSSVQR